VRFPLYAKILLWFFLNLVLLAVGAWLFARAQIHLGLDSIVAGSAGERVQAVADVMAAELKTAKREDWNTVLARFSEGYHLKFYLFRADGAQVGGESVTLPAEVGDKMRDPRAFGGRRPGENFPNQGRPLPDPRRDFFRGGENRAAPSQPAGPRPDENFRKDGQPRPEMRPRGDSQLGGQRSSNRPPIEPPLSGASEGEGFRPGGPGGSGFGEGRPRPEPREGGPGVNFGDGPRPIGPPPGPSPKFMVRAGEPELYWVGVRLQIGDRDTQRRLPLTLLAASESFAGGGLFVDYTPWIVLGAGALVVSVLFWFPLVRGITRSVSQMTAATERIAEGDFDARVATARGDELGLLASAINRMAARLAGFVHGQKRFTGDIAHELCAPIARIQMALGILEQRADEKQRAYVDDLREEVQHMSGLVNELLSFSKAGLRRKELQLEAVELAPLAQRVIPRETHTGTGEVRVEIPADLKVMAEPELLARALANLVRNALRHAGSAGPITVSAVRNGGRVVISVADSGPGVPEDSLQQIFDPFFRLDASRTRDTGGVGLGLAIVKTCVEACQGTVCARNRQPSGLQVDIVLGLAGNSAA